MHGIYNMAGVNDDISDRDLRAKLKEQGINAGPITPTTRSLYLKKLRSSLSGPDTRSSSSARVSNRKSLSPRKSIGTSPSRSPSRLDKRRSIGTSPAPVPQRKLIGFSSDEEDSSIGNSPSTTKPRRISGRFKASDSPITRSPRHGEEKPLLRFRNTNTDNENVENEEQSEMDGKMISSSDNKKPSKISPYSSLRQLFLKKSHEYEPEYKPPVDISPIKTFSHDLDNEDSNTTKKSLYIWIVLVICIATLVLLYLVFISGNYRQGSNNLKICGPSNNIQPDVCMNKETVAQILLHDLKLLLGEKNGLVECEYLPDGHNQMNKNDLNVWISSRVETGRFSPQDILYQMFLAGQNGTGLKFLTENETLATNFAETAVVKVENFALKPLLCRIGEALSKVFWQLVFLCAVLLLTLVVYFVVKYRWMLRERKTRQMFEMVDQILDVLKTRHQECQKNKHLSPCLAIPHVRDMLIKPAERESMKEIWEMAVKFLSAKDSRVRVESQCIAGEDFEVWRLLHHSSPTSPKLTAAPNTKEEKVWQGQAFEDFQSAVNPPLISPTPCLKVRNMFEPIMETRDQWHVFIQDAILEKCSEKGASIVHIAVDQSSTEGCVYVKCANHRSSGVAFRAIHGCWFDGRLVTVKFLTLKRYHQRFPDAMEAKEPLKSSGTFSSTIPKLKSEPVNESDTDSESEVSIVT